ncbi:E3 ubiquitin-protein ligase TRIM56 [Holothuria leucospilota]|uniref:E3 ubiquitin-protein ligase TRIM56 n=1 Tax=Holothuria leucospilota TaxID=206669 RepID=A0A9Q0YB58_HOLLE|nr:E3 ubiquitin-protein ligase TRIM56 [Holothuria leucospilota]
MAKVAKKKSKSTKTVKIQQDTAADRFLDDFNLCFICDRDLSEPMLLPCLHTFCRRCIDKTVKENGGKLVCISCRESGDLSSDFDLADLLPNTFIDHIRRMMAAEETESQLDENSEIDLSKYVCSSCERGNPALRRCEDCRDFLCKTCVKVHKAVKVLRDHELIDLEEWLLSKQRADRNLQHQPGVSVCPEHPDETLVQFCFTCGKLVCVDCIELKHKSPKHEMAPISEAAVSVKQSMEKRLADTHQTAAKFTGALEILEKTRKDLKDDAKRLCGEVKAAIDKERETMDMREKEYLDKIGASEKENESEIETYVDKIETKLEHITDAFEFAESLLDIGDDIQILNFSSTIQQRLNRLKTEQPVLPPRLDDLTVIDLGDAAEEDAHEEETPQPATKEEELEEDSDIIWALESTIGSRGSKPGQFDWCRGICSSLDGHVVVADWGNDRAQVFDKDGRFLCLLNSDDSESGKLSMPQDVACLRDGRFVAVDKSKFVRVYDPDGKLYVSFQTAGDYETKETGVELACVTVDRRNRIFVGDCKRNVITIHYSDGKLLQTISAVGPTHLATDSKDRIIVSCPQKQKIRVMTGEGKLLFHIDRFGTERDKLKPQGVCCDEENNIYVVHKERGGDKSVHMYDVKGQYVTCVSRGFREPYDVTLSPTGRVVVSDEDTIKLYWKGGGGF